MANFDREILITRFGLLYTVIASTFLIHFLLKQYGGAYETGDHLQIAEVIAFSLAVTFLVYGNLLYQFCRIGYYKRRRVHRPVSREALDALYDGKAPSLAILVPSYKEEKAVIWQTLLSAGLTEYPDKSVILLIDDPHTPKALEDRQALEETRRIPATLQQLFEAPAECFRLELAAFRQRCDQGEISTAAEAQHLAGLYEKAADWLEELGAAFEAGQQKTGSEHTDAFFLKSILKAPARQHQESAAALREALQAPDAAAIHRQYQRLAGIFQVRFSSFERKKYRNLSQEANKAMNLNSYIGVMGKCWREVKKADGWHLEPCSVQETGFLVPATDYLITLDADSLLLSEYAIRLIHEMERPENARLAVVQTPYSTFPGCQGLLERMAGATTDIQYLIHQGFTHWNATYWVGANALLRTEALEDIKEIRKEGGYDVQVFIQDRTVIEDTESSIDLIRKGWRLHNYPERLAYSATPPDFGALLIQRRRWANGGLLILPKLLHYLFTAPVRPALFREFFMRFHYLTSLAGVSAATGILFFYPFPDTLATVWLPLSALPYFALYARDLRLSGYKTSDVFRVYALNLMLLPVIVGGVLKSLQQGITSRKIPFGRTPKVSGRTAAPAIYCLVGILLPAICLFAFAMDVWAERWAHALFSLFNGAFFLYALTRLAGGRAILQDIFAGLRFGPITAKPSYGAKLELFNVRRT